MREKEKTAVTTPVGPFEYLWSLCGAAQSFYKFIEKFFKVYKKKIEVYRQTHFSEEKK